ncbi:MAG: pseudouridine synthase [Oscillospiraceae bacterium]
MRLDKFFSSQGILSRKDTKSAIKLGDIKVNGIIPKTSDEKIDEIKDEVCYKGKRIVFEEFVYIMLNKPQGVVSATNDNLHKCVLDLIPPSLKRDDLFPAGRLDKDTVGFVLITNDGDFAHNILSPKKHISKTYEALIDSPIKQEHINIFANGITLLSGEECKPAQLRMLENYGDTSLVEIVLVEGKYHQIKRMFASIGMNVLALKRTKMGQLQLDINLKDGECREILHKELEEILL